jgi:hypothetical protein
MQKNKEHFCRWTSVKVVTERSAGPRSFSSEATPMSEVKGNILP